MKKFAAWVVLVILISGLAFAIGHGIIMPLKKAFGSASDSPENPNTKSLSLSTINNHVKLLETFQKGGIFKKENDFKMKMMVLRMGQQRDSYLFEIHRDENDNNKVRSISMAYAFVDDSEQKGNMLICSSSNNTPKILLPSSSGDNKEVDLNTLEKVKYWNLCNEKAENLIPFFIESLPQFGLTLKE